MIHYLKRVLVDATTAGHHQAHRHGVSCRAGQERGTDRPDPRRCNPVVQGRELQDRVQPQSAPAKVVKSSSTSVPLTVTTTLGFQPASARALIEADPTLT